MTKITRMNYSVCYSCRRPKAEHTKEELSACSVRTKELTKDIPRESAPPKALIPDHVFKRWSKIKGRRL